MSSTVTHIQQALNVTVATTTETVVLTSDTLPLTNIGGEGYRIEGTLTFTTGASTNLVTIRVRQSSLTGTVVGVAAPITATAATTASFGYDVVDNAAASAPVSQYVVTVQQGAATGNGTLVIGTCATSPVTSAT